MVSEKLSFEKKRQEDAFFQVLVVYLRTSWKISIYDLIRPIFHFLPCLMCASGMRETRVWEASICTNQSTSKELLRKTPTHNDFHLFFYMLNISFFKIPSALLIHCIDFHSSCAFFNHLSRPTWIVIEKSSLSVYCQSSSLLARITDHLISLSLFPNHQDRDTVTWRRSAKESQRHAKYLFQCVCNQFIPVMSWILK